MKGRPKTQKQGMNTVPRQRKQEKVRETESRLEDRSLRYQSVGFIWGSALRHESVTVVMLEAKR